MTLGNKKKNVSTNPRGEKRTGRASPNQINRDAINKKGTFRGINKMYAFTYPCAGEREERLATLAIDSHGHLFPIRLGDSEGRGTLIQCENSP
jgi:hypothetical protein